jgi:hypothetical protein
MEDIDRKIARLVRRDGPDVPRLPVSFVMSLVQDHGLITCRVRKGRNNMRRLFLLGVVFLAAASMAAAQEKKEGASGKIHGGQVDVISAPDGTQGQAVVVINPPPWSAAEKVYRVLVLLLLMVIAVYAVWLRADIGRLLESRSAP